MATTNYGDHVLGGIHASRPAATAVPEGATYSCTTHGLEYRSDGTTWSTRSTFGSSFDGTMAEIATPATPASGNARIYPKSDGRFYSIDDAGNEYGPFDAAGGAGGPLLYADSLALHADGDEMDDDTLADWTLGGGLTTGDVTAVTTEPYDDTCLDIEFDAMGDRMLRSVPAGDNSIILTIHGITDDTSPVTAAGMMLSILRVDANGDGTALTLYSDGNLYLMVVDNYIYTSTGPTIFNTWQTPAKAAASNSPFMIRLRKSGTDYYGAISFNGGLTWIEGATPRSDVLTHDRFGIGAIFNLGGTNPRLRVGRINIV